MFECYTAPVIRYKGAENPEERKREGERGEGEERGNVCGGVCTCTFNRLITCIPKSGKPRRHAARASTKF